MTFEERKQAIIANGIVPGATIRCALDGRAGFVGPIERWAEWVHDGSVYVSLDSEGSATYAYDAHTDRYATVITPAPAPVPEVIQDMLKKIGADVSKEIDPFSQHGRPDTDEFERKVQVLADRIRAASATPAETSEVDRLRALEAEVIKVWTEDGGSVQMHTPIAWIRVLRLIPSLNQDEPTNTPDQQ
jgi:hypothetical protein